MCWFVNMIWLILMFEFLIYWDGVILSESFGVIKGDVFDGDFIEEVWKIYYVFIFNFVWVKIGVMIKEMLKKYWKNMFEIVLLSGLIVVV